LVVGTELVDDVVVGGAIGIQSVGAVGTRISQFTAIRTMTAARLGRHPQNAGVAATSSILNSLAVGFTQSGFQSTGEDQWSFDHCAGIGGNGPVFVPDDARVTARLTADPNLGGCLVYLPAQSPLRGMGLGGRSVGANVVARYQNGLLTDARLWDAATRSFPCGMVVAGSNDDPAVNCVGVSERLQVGTPGCAAP
jgi:hypothetical protein